MSAELKYLVMGVDSYQSPSNPPAKPAAQVITATVAKPAVQVISATVAKPAAMVKNMVCLSHLQQWS